MGGQVDVCAVALGGRWEDCVLGDAYDVGALINCSSAWIHYSRTLIQIRLLLKYTFSGDCGNLFSIIYSGSACINTMKLIITQSQKLIGL